MTATSVTRVTGGSGGRRGSREGHRLTRRAAGLGLVAAAAVACGPAATGNPPTPAPSAPGTAAPAASAAGQPKRGGSLVVRFWTADPPDLDPYLNVSFRSQEFAGFFYSRLLKFDNGPKVGANAFIPVPDLAESYEISKDGLTYTFKLRKNATWHNKPPLNGRPVTADDVLYSFDRFTKVSPQKSNVSMVKEVKALDQNTVAFTLNEVFAPFETTIASPMLYIMPKEVIEADGDARKRVIGSGPFVFDSIQPGVQVVAKRNPDYYLSPMPYADEVVLLIIPEDATAVAGLRARQIDVNGISQTDRKSLVETNKELQMIDYPQNLIGFFYWRLDAPPFDDVRVRQAVSLALDREEILKVLYEGNGTYNAAVPSGLDSWWLNPQGGDFGPNAKYFKRDLGAAKQLLADAGYAGGLKVPMISTLNAYGNTFNQGVELVQKQLKDAGIEVDFKPQDYSAYVSSTFLGKFDPGTLVYGLETPFQEPHDYLYQMYHPKGTRNHAGVNDPELTTMIEQQMRTIDRNERKKLIFEIQRYLAGKQYYVVGPIGNVTVAVQPWVKDLFPQSDYGRASEQYLKPYLDGKP